MQTLRNLVSHAKMGIKHVKTKHPELDDKVKTEIATIITVFGPLISDMRTLEVAVVDVIEDNKQPAGELHQDTPEESHQDTPEESQQYTPEELHQGSPEESHQESPEKRDLSHVKVDIPGLLEIFQDLWVAVQSAKDELSRINEAGSQDSAELGAELEEFIRHCEPIVNNLNDLANIFDDIVDQLVEKETDKPVTHVEPAVTAEPVTPGSQDSGSPALDRRGWKTNPLFAVESSKQRPDPVKVEAAAREKLLQAEEFQ
jgi:hypothetical protein